MTRLERKHFQAIADIIADIQNDKERTETAQHFADNLRAYNNKFNESRFLAACNA